jgi:RNA polymerase sigma-70 factor (ECF subfamily)
MLSIAAESTPSSDWQANHLAKAPQPRTPTAPPSRKLDAAALERLFQEARPRLLSTAQRVLGDADEAEDAVQDALVKAWQKLDRFEGRSAFTTWMHRITVNTALDHRRRRATAAGGAGSAGKGLRAVEAQAGDAESAAMAQSSAVVSAPETPERLYARAESAAMVHRALGRLPAPHAEAVRLCDLEGESYATIATIARCPIGTVMSRLYHARRKLAQELGATAANDDDLAALRAA